MYVFNDMVCTFTNDEQPHFWFGVWFGIDCVISKENSYYCLWMFFGHIMCVCNKFNTENKRMKWIEGMCEYLHSHALNYI